MIAIKKPENRVFYACFGVFLLLSTCITPLCAAEFTAHRINTWAPDIPGKALRVLFILPQHAQGDITDLAAQLEMEWEAVYLWDRDHLGYDPQQPMPLYPQGTDQAVRKALDKALKKKWDAIVLANLNPAVLPKNTQDSLLRYVKHGGGLVTAFLTETGEHPFLDALNAGPRHPATAAVRGVLPVDDWGSFDIEQFLEWRSLEAGQILHLHYRGDLPKSHAWVPRRSQVYPGDTAYLENAQALMAKALLAAAQRQPAYRIHEVLYQAPATPREEDRPPELDALTPENFQKPESTVKPRSYQVTLTEALDKTCQVRVRVRALNSEARVEYDFKDPFPAGSTTYSFNLILPAGRYWIDVYLYREEEILDWFSLEENTYSWPALRQVSLSKSVLRPNDSVTVTLQLVPSVASTSQPSRIYIKALDTLPRLDGGTGRIVSEGIATLAPGQQRVDLLLRFSDLLGPVVRLECFAEGGAGNPKNLQITSALPQWSCFLTVAQPLPAESPYVAALGNEGTEFQARHRMGVLRAMGLDALQSAADAGEGMLAGAEGLYHIPLAAQYATPHGGTGFKRMPCVNDAEYLRIEGNRLNDLRQDQASGNTLGFSLGQGLCLTESDENLCHAETCQAAYRQWLEQHRARLPIGFTAAPPFASLEEALQQDALLAWFLFRQFMEDSFLHLMTQARDSLQGDGSTTWAGGVSLDQVSPYAGYAWPSMLRSLDMLTLPADRLSIARLRSYQKKEDGHALFIPDAERRKLSLQDREAATAQGRWLAHIAMLNQIRGVQLGNAFTTIATPSNESILLPDNTPDPFAEAALEAMQFWKAGRAAVLRRATRNPARIAVYDHRYAAWLPQLDPALGGNSTATIVHWLDAMGYANDLVDRDLLLAKELENYPVLILPNAIALDKQEVEALRRYVNRGGRLLADRLPGKWGDWGVSQNTSPLATLFGARWRASAAAQPVTALQFESENKPVPALGYADTLALSPRATALATTAPRDDASPLPLWLAMTTEAGHCLLLNHAIPPVAPSRHSQWFHKRLKRFLEEAGCTPEIPLHQDAKNVFRGHRFAFTYGEATLWAVLADPDQDHGVQKISLTFPKGLHIYDMHTGENLRGGKKTTLKLAPGELALFSLLPRPALPLTLRATDTIQPGRRFPVMVEPEEGEGVDPMGGIWFSLRHADGNALPHFSRFVPFANGRAATFFPMAANEQESSCTLNWLNPLTGKAHQQWLGKSTYMRRQTGTEYP